MFHDIWHDLLVDLQGGGELVAPRGKATREIIGYQLFLENMLANVLAVPGRDLNYRFMVAEWAWIMCGRNDLGALVRYNSKYREYSDDGITLAGAYGPRVHAQLAYVVETLRHDRSSRQAVMSIWRDAPTPSKDIPCTLSHQFLIRPVDGIDRLHMITTMRSSDAWLGIPYDVFSFTMMANLVAARVGVVPGSLTLTLGSAHLYEENWDAANLVCHSIEQGNAGTIYSPLLPPDFPEEKFNRALDGPLMVGDVGTAPQPYGYYLCALEAKKSEDAFKLLTEAAGRWR